MKLMRTVVCGIGIGALVTGCAIAPGPGDKQGDPPPRIVNRDSHDDSRNDDNRNRNCWESTSLHSNCYWDNPSAFGPVPANLAQAAQSACSELDIKDVQYKATGYHLRALDLDGKPFREGGYYCVRK